MELSQTPEQAALTKGMTTPSIKKQRIVQPVSPLQALCDGPPHRFGVHWFLSIHGAEYIGLYLWLAKDACWSQFRWAKTALVFGGLATIWLSAMTTAAFRARLYSEAYLACGLLLWLLANFSWMVGEFCSLSFDPNDTDESWEDLGNAVARYLLLLSVVTFVVFFTILLPRHVFASDRESLWFLEYTSPPCPWPAYFQEFRIWSSVHLLAWAIKDCFWAWDLSIPYAIAFCATIVLNLDLIHRLAVYSLQYIPLVHAVIMLCWVCANGVWVLGELSSEENLKQSDFESYKFVWKKSMLVDPAFEPRWMAGWVFILAGGVVIVFYIQWTIVTIKGKVPSFDDFKAACSEAILHDGGDSNIREELDGVAL